MIDRAFVVGHEAAHVVVATVFGPRPGRAEIGHRGGEAKAYARADDQRDR